MGCAAGWRRFKPQLKLAGWRLKFFQMPKKRITTVYTGLGDDGKTSLLGGKRVRKSSPRVNAYGDVDELNSVLGVACTKAVDPRVKELLREIQNALFTVGSDLATPRDSTFSPPRVTAGMAKRLEERIDEFLPEVGELREFVLPGGAEGAAWLHLARTVCRRAERGVEEFFGDSEEGSRILVYLNRLSDLLFVLARVENKAAGTGEIFVDFGRGEDG